MGFNIGISISPDHEDFDSSYMECRQHLGREYYKWVDEFAVYGQSACIIQTGIFFGLDLEPLTKLIYVDGEVDEAYIQAGTQKTEALIQLIVQLIQAVNNTPSFIDNISYQTDKTLFSRSKEADPNPWKSYLVEGDFLEHLSRIKEILMCFQSRGHEEVFFMAI